MVCISLTANAQFSMFGGGNRANQDSLRKIAAADYADMLAKVGVGQPREGRQPNSQDESKHPNYDELTANPYPFYPDSPRHPRQKYLLTVKGLALFNEIPNA